MKIGIFIHLFHLDLFNEFSNYILNVKKIFDDVVIIFTLDNNDNSKLFFDNTIKPFFCNNNENNLHIIYIENYGVDIGSFFQQIQYVRKNEIKFDFILKIHTKTSKWPIRNFINWRHELIKPIVDINNLYIIKNYIENKNFDKEIGYIAAHSCLESRSVDIYKKNNLHGVKIICDKFPHIKENYIDFIGGTMFWINFKIIEKFITPDLISFMSSYFSYKKPPPDYISNLIHFEYVFERLITGSFCFDYINILINSNCHNHDNKTMYHPENITLHCPSFLVDNFYKNELNNLQNLINTNI